MINGVDFGRVYVLPDAIIQCVPQQEPEILLRDYKSIRNVQQLLLRYCNFDYTREHGLSQGLDLLIRSQLPGDMNFSRITAVLTISSAEI